ncbi:MAG: hypothetical protein LBT22_06975, partial [Peptococcaceae bacterium]|nr:hypothetical protein [Peptococcaceae bacterium]
MIYAGKILPKLAALLLCAVVALSAAPMIPRTALADGGLVGPLPGDAIDVGWDASPRSGDGWEFDGVDTYTITGDVTVIGNNYDGGALVFDIADGHIVTWTASYSAASTDDGYVLVEVRGEGCFLLGDGGITLLSQWDYGTAVQTDSGVDLIVSHDSSITVLGDTYSCVAVRAAGSVSVTDGSEVWAASETACTAIYADGDVTVEDSRVVADSPVGVAIRSDRDVQIQVLGGSKVWSDGGAILARQADVLLGGDSIVNVLGVLAFADGELLGNAVTARDVTVLDEARVKAINGAAIFYSGELYISGGLVLAYGDGIGGAVFTIDETAEAEAAEVSHTLNVIFKCASPDIEPGVEYTDSFVPDESSFAGDGVVLAWDFVAWFYAEEPYGYAGDDTTDLVAYPTEDVEYGWNTRRGYMGFWWSYADNSGTFWFDTMNPKKPLKPNPKPDPSIDP